LTAKEIIDIVGSESWKTAYKFSFVRSPEPNTTTAPRSNAAEKIAKSPILK